MTKLAPDSLTRAGSAVRQDCALVGVRSERPLIVITNDDGIDSPALLPLRAALASLGDVRIVVPDHNCSGAARSITMHSPLWVETVRLPDGSVAYSTDGTPVDCVRMAALGLLDRQPDLIVSGINLGENLGDDITYSGTVAAALEGIMLDIPAVAVSAHDYHAGYDLEVPARFVQRLVGTIRRHGFPAKTLLNVNCPDRSWDELAGAKLTTLGKRIYGDKVRYQETHGNRRRYFIYNDSLDYQEESGTDFEAVANGYVSITPLHFDLMSHAALERLRCWEPELTLHGDRVGPPYGAVVFDLDGTVVDSVELIVASFEYAIRKVLGRVPTREECIKNVGRPLREQMVMLAPDRADELVAAYQEFNHREHDRMLTLYDGIPGLLHGLQCGGVKLGLVTSKSRRTTEMAFTLTGIDRYFDAVVCADESPRNKPAPDPLLLCLDRLGVSAKEAIYVGDSPSDIQAATAAGISSIAVTWGVFNEDILRAERPAQLVHTVPELAKALGL